MNIDSHIYNIKHFNVLWHYYYMIQTWALLASCPVLTQLAVIRVAQNLIRNHNYQS